MPFLKATLTFNSHKTGIASVISLLSFPLKSEEVNGGTGKGERGCFFAAHAGCPL